MSYLHYSVGDRAMLFRGVAIAVNITNFAGRGNLW